MQRYSANVIKIISDFQQTYVEVKTLRRTIKTSRLYDYTESSKNCSDVQDQEMIFFKEYEIKKIFGRH